MIESDPMDGVKVGMRLERVEPYRDGVSMLRSLARRIGSDA